MIQHTSLFPPEMYEQIKEVAKKEKVTFNEAVRLLIEWGLETAEDNSPGPRCSLTGMICIKGCNQRTCAGMHIPINEWPRQ